MTITQQTNAGATVKATVLPNGPVTEMRWYRTRTGAGLLVVFRRGSDGPVESVTFTAKIWAGCVHSAYWHRPAGKSLPLAPYHPSPGRRSRGVLLRQNGAKF